MGKILIIRGGALGDFVLTLPAIQLMRRNFPDTRIEVLGYPNVMPMAEIAGLTDGTRSMEYGPLSLFFVPGAELPADLVDYFASFDVVISYLYDPDGYFEGNLRKAGVETLIRGPHKVLEDPGEPIPAATQLAKPLEQLALFLDEPFVHLFDPEESPPTRQSGPVIAIHPGSGSPRKNWSYEGWIDVATSLLEKWPDTQFAIISGEAEDQTISQFLALAEDASLPLRHLLHLSLPDLTNELRSADLFLGHDTGVGHVAAACGIPSVLLFGPTNPDIWAPQNPNVFILQAPSQDLSRISSRAICEKVFEVLHTLSTE